MSTTEEFIKDHRPVRSVVFQDSMSLVMCYADPCRRPILAHGKREVKKEIKDVYSIIEYLNKANEEGEPIDLIFVSKDQYDSLIAQQSRLNNTKLIIFSNEAPRLRGQGIPSVNFDDYMGIDSLNAIIAYVVFDELLTD